MATLKNLLDNGLKVGALVKAFDAVFQYAGKDLLYVVKTKNKELAKYAQLIDVDFIEYLCLDTFNGEITTAYDCGIAADDLPIPEPVDMTGWVVDSEGYKHQIEHLHAGDVNYSSGFDEETEMQPDYFEFTNGGHAFVYECRACLPPEKQ